MNRWAGRVQFAAERIVIGVLGVIRFRVRVRGCAHVLEIGFSERPFVGGKRAHARAGFTSREKDCAKRRDRDEEDLGVISASQIRSPELLTVIHKLPQ